MSGRIARYLDRVKTLQEDGRHAIRVVAVEGDSFDRTAEELVELSSAMGVRLSVETHNHGKRMFASTEDADRMEAMTGVLMAGMGAVAPEDDIVVYVESDLLWNAETIFDLIEIARRKELVDIIAPMIYSAPGIFYDIFVYRMNGRRFVPLPPYHSDLSPSGITEIDSVGSCLAMRSEIARTVVPAGKVGLISWCEGARSAGWRIGVDVDLAIKHP